ncbi:MAG: ATP-binding protein [Acidobacteria bacterium]|nr:ATP-binding protein [Acidobacteriota bacterium]
MNPEPHRFHVAIASRFENIELVQVVLQDTLEGLGVGEDDRHWVDLAVREAVANAIRHGNQQDPTKRVDVDFELSGGALVIRVKDEGPGFSPEEVADPLAEENLLRSNGRGLLYMRSCMDTIDWAPHPDGGTEVTLRKRLPALGAGTRAQEE